MKTDGHRPDIIKWILHDLFHIWGIYLVLNPAFIAIYPFGNILVRHLSHWEVWVYSFNLNHWICSTRVLNPRNPKLLALYSCSIWRCSASPFPGQVVGMPHAGDNLARWDSPPITNCKTFVAPDLPVKMARSDQQRRRWELLFGWVAYYHKVFVSDTCQYLCLLLKLIEA